MEEIVNKIENLRSKEDFIEFIHLLIIDLKTNPDDWENNTVETYLRGMAGWIESMDGFYNNTNQHLPKQISWKVFANILIGGSVFEY